LPTNTRQTYPDLATVVNVWPRLTPAVRAAILKLAQAASK
jgi:hypothetical protein